MTSKNLPLFTFFPDRPAALATLAILALASPAALAQPSSAPASSPALLTKEESSWFSNPRALTRADMGLQKSGEAYFSPDGRQVCFQAVPDGKTDYQIYIIEADGTGLERISTGVGATTCAYFSPDGTKLIFGSNHLDPRPVGMPDDVRDAVEKAGARNYQWSFYPGMDIFEFTLRTRHTEWLVKARGYDAEGSYSPDGKWIVFTSMRDGDQEVYICEANGNDHRRITRAKGYDGGPFFSPDGKRVVYRSDRHDNGNLQIFTNNLDGTDEQALTDDKDVLHWCPFWHPSGKWLVFTRAEHKEGARPNYDLYLLEIATKKQIRVTTDPTFDGLPAFSPDGRKLMWTSKRGGLSGSQVFIADWHGLTPDGRLAAP